MYGLETPGLHDETEIQGSVERHAAYLLETLRRHRCAGPYRLAGHSAGGRVAFELARQLEEQGETVQQLIILDTWAPHPLAGFALSGREVLRNVIQLLESLTNSGLDLSDELLDAQADDESRHALVMQRLRERGPREHDPLAMLGGDLRHIVAVYHAMSRNQAAYDPQTPVHCPILLVRAAEEEAGVAEASGAAPDWGWQAFSTAPVRVIRAPGTHLSMLAEPHVKTLAALLTDHLSSGAGLSNPTTTTG